jgi:flagellar hook-length control protein FliK
MQVNFSANLPNAAGETSAKSTEIADADAANGFFAQMDHILNQSENSSDVVDGDAPSAATNSQGQNTAKSRNDGILNSTQAPQVKNISAQNISGPLSGLFQVSDGGDSEALGAQFSLGIVGTSGGLAPLPGVESSPAQIKEGEKEEDKSAMAVQFPTDSTAAVHNPQSLITWDLSAHFEEIMQSQNAVGDDPSVVNDGKPIEEAGAGFPVEASTDANTAGMTSGLRIPISVGPNIDSNQNLNRMDLQSGDAGQRGWDVDLYTSISTNDSFSGAGSIEQNRSMQRTIQEKLQDSFQSLSSQSGNEAALPMTEPQDGVQNTPVSSDSLAAGNSEVFREMPDQSQWVYGMREPGLADDAGATENSESENIISPEAFLKSPLKAGQASIMNEDAANSSAGQEPPEYTTGFRPAAQSNPGFKQSDPIRTESSVADSRSPIQSVIASSSAPSGEATAAAGGPTAQSSASPAPEIVYQLAEQISIQVRDGTSEIRIQLKPDNLGSLEIRAENTIYGVSARISTESNAVKSYLENNLQALQQTLQDQGLKIDRIHIVVQNSFDSQSSSGFSAQLGYTGSGQNGRESQFSSGKSGSSSENPADDEALDPASWLALNPNNRFYTVA